MNVCLTSIPELEARLEATGEEATKARLEALVDLAYALRATEQWDRMQSLSLEAVKIARAFDDGLSEGRATMVLAFVQYIRSDLKSALASCTTALQLTMSDVHTQASIGVIVAMVQWTLGNFDEALRHIDRSLPVLREVKDQITQAFAVVAKGGIFHSLGQYDLSVACFRDALELCRDIGFEIGVARSLSGLGSAYQALGLSSAALECHLDSYAIAEKSNHGIGLSRSLTDLGQVYEGQGRLDEALRSHERALAIREQEQYLQPQTTNLFHLGSIHYKLGNLQRALDYLHRGMAIAEEIGARPKICDFHRLLSELYEKSGNLSRALHHYKAYERIKAELFSDQATLRHKALELESQLEIHRLKNVELVQLLDELQATQAELLNKEKMASLGSLVAALAHEINSPLGVIQSASDLTLRCADKLHGDENNPVTETLRTNARLVTDASRRIGKLVTSLKAFAHLDRAEFGEIDLVQSLEHTLALLEPEFRGRVSVERDYQPVPRLHAYVGELNQVFMNLLRNAAQAIEGPGVINVQTRAASEAVRVSVIDSGKGIPEELRKSIFSPGFNKDGERVKGSFSLFGCQSIARKHGGSIEVMSQLGHGSTFTLVLPSALVNASEPLRYSQASN